MMVNLKEVEYILIEEQDDIPELGAYSFFGIMAVRRMSDKCEQLSHVRNVSTNRDFTAALVKRCNRAKLSPVHLQDFIVDVLGS